MGFGALKADVPGDTANGLGISVALPVGCPVGLPAGVVLLPMGLVYMLPRDLFNIINKFL